jgi:hAT family C-terminal dimerisation region
VSLAHDYLSIVASSISSECAFSQSGITISKHCNRLKSDIVKALQCIKCAIRHDLPFCETGPSSLEEDNIDEVEVEVDPGEQPEEGEIEEGWDHLFLEDVDDLQSDTDVDQDS